jgi:hypothetical protein
MGKAKIEEVFKNTYLGDKISFNSDIGKAFELGYNLAKEQDKKKIIIDETLVIKTIPIKIKL